MELAREEIGADDLLATKTIEAANKSLQMVCYRRATKAQISKARSASSHKIISLPKNKKNTSNPKTTSTVDSLQKIGG